MILPVLLILPMAAALSCWAWRGDPRIAARGSAVTSGAGFVLALILAGQVLKAGAVGFGRGDFLRADGLSAVLILVVSLVAWISLWYGEGILRRARDRKELDDARLRRYYLLTNLFLFTMLLSVTANNVGVMWVAVEATTITTAFLIGLEDSREALEASWKYILIGSVGIALAFVGTVLGYFDFVQRVGETPHALNWSVLAGVAGRLNGDVLRVAFVFILVGYGTKAGLAPMHTWLPDAHSEAPAPTSSMMSGSLLVVALYAILRWKVVVDACVGPLFTDRMLILVGTLSVAVAAILLIRQVSYKRMLAYSSVEHVGLMCVGAGLGPLGTLAALLHMIGHAAGKSLLFLLSGSILEAYGSTRIVMVRGLLRARPWTGALFLAGTLALLGLPPFSLFLSEVMIFRAGFLTGHTAVTGLLILLTLTIFVFFLGYVNRILYGHPPAEMPEGRESRPGEMLPLAVNLAVLLAAGIVIPRPLLNLLRLAAGVIHPMIDLDALSSKLREALSPGGATGFSVQENVIRFEVAREGIREAARLLLAGFSMDLSLLLANDRREDRGAFDLVYLFAHPGENWFAEMTVPVPAEEPRYPSLATLCYPASRYEREIRDLFGLHPAGHPDLRPLVRHGFWPEDYHPLRKDASPPEQFVDDGSPFPFHRVEGEGVYEIPVGPVHAGIIEPGHFRFSVDGETILEMKSRLYFTHKGTEKLFEGRLPEEALPLSERISGDTAVGHSLAFCQALESMAGLQVPPRARFLRTVLLEMERLYNHVADFGMIASDTGFAVAHSHAFRIREGLFRLNKALTGHRLLRGLILPGGVSRDFPGGVPLGAELEKVARDFDELVEICLANNMLRDRLRGAGKLEREMARDQGVLGIVARASGIDRDVRRDHPFAAYGDLKFKVTLEETGDVQGRAFVRVGEFRESVALIRQALSLMPGGGLRAPAAPLPPWRNAFGLVEGWRGAILHWIQSDGAGRLYRVKVKDPSFVNWRALSYALRGNIVPDFPLCNKSFNLSYSGNDL